LACYGDFFLQLGLALLVAVRYYKHIEAIHTQGKQMYTTRTITVTDTHTNEVVHTLENPGKEQIDAIRFMYNALRCDGRYQASEQRRKYDSFGQGLIDSITRSMPL